LCNQEAVAREEPGVISYDACSEAGRQELLHPYLFVTAVAASPAVNNRAGAACKSSRSLTPVSQPRDSLTAACAWGRADTQQ